MPCSSDTDSILRVIPAVECKGSASRKSFNYRNFRIGGGPLLQRLLNPRRRTIGVSGDFASPNVASRTEQTAHAELAPMSVRRADRSGRLEAVPLDSQLFDLRFERLPGYAQLGSSTGGPPMTPSASRSACSITSRSCSTRLATKGLRVATECGATTGVSQVSSTANVSPSHRITARSITFCNSRTLPGQS